MIFKEFLEENCLSVSNKKYQARNFLSKLAYLFYSPPSLCTSGKGITDNLRSAIEILFIAKGEGGYRHVFRIFNMGFLAMATDSFNDDLYFIVCYKL